MDNLIINKILDNPIFTKINNYQICTEIKLIKITIIFFPYCFINFQKFQNQQV